MKRLKPVHISILTVVIFVVALFLGTKSEWWILDGRKTPLDYSSTGHGSETEIITENTEITDVITEEDHESTQVTGSSTVQTALDLGISQEEIEKVLEGEIDDTSQLIKTIATERGLKFGEVKDALNALLAD